MRFISRVHLCLATLGTLALMACGRAPEPAAPPPSHSQQVTELLKSLETGDPAPQAYLHPDRFIQHDLSVGDGLEGFRAYLRTLPSGSVRVNTVRLIEDGDFVIAQTEYALPEAKVGFDIFRFEEGKIVEHWNNLQDKAPGPSPSGHTMLDGPTEPTDLDKTEANKALMRTYMSDLLQGHTETFRSYFDGNNYLQHSPLVADGLTGLFAGLSDLAKKGLAVKYAQVHQVLGQGSFVLVVSDGSFGPSPMSYYDFYRLQDGKIAEHWDVLEVIPPSGTWKNPNGKY